MSKLQIAFRHMRKYESIETAIRKKADMLDRVYPRIQSIHALVDMPHQRRAKGRLFHVRVAILVPGREIVVTRQSDQNQGHQNLQAAVADAFNAARREIRDFAVQARDHSFSGRIAPAEQPTHGVA